jgi:hypothetical protein
MVHAVRIKKEDRLIVAVENQEDYEETMKYMAGTEYEVIPYSNMVQKAKGIGNIIIVMSPDIYL